MDCERRLGKGAKGHRSSGGRVWRSKGQVLLSSLQALPVGPVQPRLVGQPLSTDEYLLSEIAIREDRLEQADAANDETFGDASGWDVEEMLASAAAGPAVGKHERLVGTCGFMGTPPKKYVSRLSAVELNATYHDRGDTTYEQQAAAYAKLGLRVVVKVSGYATHEANLAEPSTWWPWLRSKYASFVNAGVLVGFLWQLPPSFACGSDHLARLDALGSLLRSPGQTQSWLQLRHAFEFRHPSWFGSSSVSDTLSRHSLHLVRLHVMNDTGWAGDLESGWHGAEASDCPAEFVYIRCFGSSGRSIGSYSPAELENIAAMAGQAASAVVMFGQGDVPSQAFSNARDLRHLLDGEVLQGLQNAAPKADRSFRPDTTEAQEMLSGTVIGTAHGKDRRVMIDVGGRKGYLGLRHAKKRGLSFKRGATVSNLRVEAEEGEFLILSISNAGKVDEFTTVMS
eukprot:TRINITY_DN84115_c0_g1_i1.p1 TRINITY_DN84115_c0_g1~~TRINITY_DN84115_c0_g1_i1.p1  ORF type:complete len:454 (-),score=82.34 TRINITY_DN84115_c0_g1_i1:50-1411(-)